MNKAEKELVLLIKFLPIFIIFTVMLFIIIFLYQETNNRFVQQNKKLEEKYIELNKNLVKFQVNNMKDMITYEKIQSIKNLRRNLKRQVSNAHNIAMSIYKNNKDKPFLELKKLIKDALRDIKFNEDRGYFFIFDLQGYNILHPIEPKLEDKYMIEYQDKRGTFLLKEMNKILRKKDATFYSWYWNKPDDKDNEYEKIGYFKLFKPFNWYIGTGEYVIDSQKKLKRDIGKKISDFRYKEDGYIFILTYDGEYISYYNHNIIGKNIKDLNLAKDVVETQKRLVNLAANTKTGGFITYSHRDKPHSLEKEMSKVSYIDRINDWNWIIGSGFYMDDFYKELAQKKEELDNQNNEAIKKLFLGCLFIMFLLIGIFFYLSTVIEKKFFKYKDNIKDHINQNIKKDNLLSHQAKFAVMGEMLANISHQWRQPLSTISTIISGLKMERELGIIDENSQKKAFNSIKNNVDYLSETVNDFTNFFKPDINKREFDINKTIEKTINLLSPQFKLNGIEIILELNTHKIIGLENQLIQVLINILNNAKDKLVNSKDKKLIFVSNEFDDENIIIVIKDNAGGIKEEIITKIFEPYFTTKSSVKGTGIGLFMSKEIINKNFNGEIKVKNIEYEYKSKVYFGAKFIITFPVKND